MIKYLKDLISLYKLHKDISIIQNPNFTEYILKVVKKKWRDKKHSTRRNLLASVIKQYRTLHPYIPQFAENEKKYKKYFTLENHIPSFEHLIELLSSGKDVWLRKFRNNSYYKGDRYSEYWSNGTSGKKYTVKLGEIDEQRRWIYTDPYVNGDAIDKQDFTMYLFATPEQISAEKRRLNRRKRIQKQIEEKQEEISQLYKKLNNGK